MQTSSSTAASPHVPFLSLLPFPAAGDPKNRQLIISIGPQRMATMLKRLGGAGAVQVG